VVERKQILADDLKEAWENVDLEQMAEKWHCIHCDMIDAEGHFDPAVYDGRSVAMITAEAEDGLGAALESRKSAVEATARPYVYSTWSRSHDLKTGEVLEENMVITVAVHPDRDHIYQVFHPFEKKDDKIVWGERRACHITRSSIEQGLEQFLERDES